MQALFVADFIEASNDSCTERLAAAGRLFGKIEIEKALLVSISLAVR